jgi:hypothetical protein
LGKLFAGRHGLGSITHATINWKIVYQPAQPASRWNHAGHGMTCRQGGHPLQRQMSLQRGGRPARWMVAVTAPSSSSSLSLSSMGVEDEEYTNRCLLAPVAIGVAHQAAYSKGYSPACPDTPCKGSSYMWPMGWSADAEFKSMGYGSNDIVHTRRGTTR